MQWLGSFSLFLGFRLLWAVCYSFVPFCRVSYRWCLYFILMFCYFIRYSLHSFSFSLSVIFIFRFLSVVAEQFVFIVNFYRFFQYLSNRRNGSILPHFPWEFVPRIPENISKAKKHSLLLWIHTVIGSIIFFGANTAYVKLKYPWKYGWYPYPHAMKCWHAVVNDFLFLSSYLILSFFVCECSLSVYFSHLPSCA